MIQCCQHSCFAFKSCRSIRIVRECFRKEFDCHTTAELRVGGLIDLSHAACSQVAGYFVVCEFCSDHGCDDELLADSIKLPVSHSLFETSRRKECEKGLSWRITG